MPQTLLECDTLNVWAIDHKPFTNPVMIEQAPWLIQPIKGNRSKRLFGLPAPLVKGKKIAQIRYQINSPACRQAGITQYPINQNVTI